MYNTIKLFSTIAKAVPKYQSYNSRELIAEYREKGDSSIIAVLATRVFGITAVYAKNKNMYSKFDAEDIAESYTHALNYSIAHYKLSSSSKWESFYVWCLNSTLSQMFATSSRQKRAINYTGMMVEKVKTKGGEGTEIDTKEIVNCCIGSIDDLDIDIPDESAYDSEVRSLSQQDLINLVQACCIEDAETKSSLNKLSQKEREEVIQGIIEERKVFDRRLKNRADFIKTIYGVSDKLTDTDMCIELKLFRSKNRNTTEEQREELIHIYEKLVAERSLRKINATALSKYGIICDTTELGIIRNQVVTAMKKHETEVRAILGEVS